MISPNTGRGTVATNSSLKALITLMITHPCPNDDRKKSRECQTNKPKLHLKTPLMQDKRWNETELTYCIGAAFRTFSTNFFIKLVFVRCRNKLECLTKNILPKSKLCGLTLFA